MIKLSQMVLKKVIRVHNEEIRLFCPESGQLGIQLKTQIIWS